MRKIALGLLFLAVSVAAPLSAKADIILEGSLGKGLAVKPEVKVQETNIMLAPGVSVLSSILRLQLGILGELGDVEGSNFDLELRPMVTISPPVLPVYGRLIFAVTDLLHYKDEGHLTYGGALGVSFSLFGLGVFAEAGALPATKSGQDTTLVLEGRLGAMFQF